MLHRQRGISLLWVAVIMGVLAAVMMAGLMSMRHERNYFAEAWAKVTDKVPAQAMEQAAALADAPAQPLKRCVIDGQTVISNTECKDDNRSTRTIDIHDTKGIEAPRVPPKPPEAAPGSNPALDKAIEQQT
jgi:type II secretory pathway pseudopilin PulG